MLETAEDYPPTSGLPRHESESKRGVFNLPRWQPVHDRRPGHQAKTSGGQSCLGAVGEEMDSSIRSLSLITVCSSLHPPATQSSGNAARAAMETLQAGGG